MAEAVTAHRMHPLVGRHGASADVAIAPAPPAARLSLRARLDALPSLEKALGITLPRDPKRAVAGERSSRAALWLGPDEWLVIDEGDHRAAGEMMDAVHKSGAMASAVDISHRNTAILVSGEAAVDLVSAGCPQDLSPDAFPIGACSRTVLGKIEIVLWRVSEEVWRVECWRSFADYAFTFLTEAARDVR